MPKGVTKFRFSNSRIEKIEHPEKGQVIYKDSVLNGMGLLAGKNTKSFFVQGQVQTRTIRHSIGRFPILTVEIARKRSLKALAQMAEGINPNDQRASSLRLSKITLDDAVGAYISARKSLSPRTAQDYKAILNRYFRDWKSTPIVCITPEKIIRRHRELGDRLSGSTANTAMRALRAVLNFSKAMHPKLPENPVLRLTQTRSWYRECRRTNYIQPSQLRDWWLATEELENHDFRDFLQLALLTGMRKSEVLSLQWKNISFGDQSLRIEETKNGDPLTLPLSDYLCDLLKNRTNNSIWVFPSIGISGHIVEPKKAVKQVCDISGVEFTMHDLRRTFLTIAESLDIPAYALKRLVNHRISDVTAGYIQITVERLRKPMQKITDYVLDHVHSKKCSTKH